MSNVLAKVGAANVMFDDIRRQNYAMAGLGREFPNHEVFCEIVLEACESSNRVQNATPARDRGADRKSHPFQHPRHQSAAPEVRVHAGCFKMRPEAWSGNSAVRTGRNAELLILKFRRNGAQQGGRYPNVTV